MSAPASIPARRPVWAAPAIAAGVWAALVVAGLALETGGLVEGPLCPFRRLTGVPCPTCGLTRGVQQLLAGDPLGGWLRNPLAFTVAGGTALLVALRLVTGRWPLPRLTGRRRLAAWGLATLAFAANWAYVILCVG